MQKSLISIIVPVYNVEKHIKKCVDSLLSQTYPNIEIIIINDGSTDQTAQILEEYSNETKIRIFHQENKGVSFGRNFGLKQAQGDFICFVDGDDFVAPEYCEKLHQNLVENDADISVCQFVRVIGDKYEPQKIKYKSKVFSRNEALSLIFEDNELRSYPCGKLFKKEVIKGFTFPLDKKAFEDYATIFRIIEKSDKIVIFDDLLYYYLLNEGSLSYNTNTQMFYNLFSAVMEMYEYAKKMKNELPNWKKIVKKTAVQTHRSIKYISVFQKMENDSLLLKQIQNEMMKFYDSEKKNIPLSIKWKLFLFLKHPKLYNLYIDWKKRKKK